MGGLDVFTDSININLNNPTSYAKLKVTSYALGLNLSAKILRKIQFLRNQKLHLSITYQLQFPLNFLVLVWF